MFAKLARADLNWIQTVHSGRLLSGFLNDATLIRATASRSIVTLGENYLKVIILIGTMFYMDARFSVLILIFMPIAWFVLSRQRRKMRKSTTQVAPGNRRSFRAHHPDLARHAHRARLPAGRPGGGARRFGHQSRARIHHARHARPRAVEPLDRAVDRSRLRAGHLFRRHQGRARRSHPRPLHGLHDGGAADLHAAEERRHLADAAARRHRRGKPGVRRDRPSGHSRRGGGCQAAQAREGRDRVQERVLRLRARERRAEGGQSHRALWAHGGAGRAVRLGQEHDGQPHARASSIPTTARC